MESIVDAMLVEFNDENSLLTTLVSLDQKGGALDVCIHRSCLVVGGLSDGHQREIDAARNRVDSYWGSRARV